MDNQIHTAKYNVITFLPKNLFYQFSKMTNLYFLTMTLLDVRFVLSLYDCLLVLYQPETTYDGVPTKFRGSCIDGQGYL